MRVIYFLSTDRHLAEVSAGIGIVGTICLILFVRPAGATQIYCTGLLMAIEDMDVDRVMSLRESMRTMEDVDIKWVICWWCISLLRRNLGVKTDLLNHQN